MEPVTGAGGSAQCPPTEKLTVPNKQPAPEKLDVRSELERVRIAYREHLPTGTRLAENLVVRLRDLPDFGAEDAEVLGSAYTLLGLMQCLNDEQPIADEQFAHAVQAFARVPPDRLERGLAVTAADHGIALQRTGAHSAAVSALRRAVELGQDTPDVKRYLGAALRDQGEQEQAYTVLAEAVRRAPEDWQAWEWLAALAEDLGHDPMETANEWAAAGQILRKNGLIRPAAQAYRQAVRLRPDDVGLLIAAGGTLSEANDPEATGMLQHAVDLPADPDDRLQIANLLLRLRDGTTAVKLAREVLDADPDNERAVIELARALISLRDNESSRQAKQTLTRFLQSHPGSVYAEALLGDMYRAQNRPKQAIRHFDRALARGVDQTDPSAFLHGSKGQALLQLGQTEEGVAELLTAAERDPDLPWVRLELADVYRAQGDPDAEIRVLRDLIDRGLLDKDPAKRTEVLVRLGIGLAAKDDPDAVAVLRQVLDVDSLDVKVLRPLTMALLRGGYEDQALGALDHAERAVPDDLDVRALRGYVFYQIGRLDDAADLLTDLLSQAGDRWQDRALLGEIERVRGNLPAALEQLNQILTEHPDDTWSLSSRAAVYLDMGEQDKAKRDLELCLQSEPRDLFSLKVLREMLISQGHLANAVKAFRDAVEAPGPEPTAELLREYGETLRLAGAYPQARDALDKALRQNPRDALTRRALGRLLLDQGKYDEALATFDEAAQDMLDDAAWYEGCTVRILSGRYAEALTRLDERIAAQPDDADAWWMRGWLYYRVGAWPQALEAADQAAWLEPGDPQNHLLLGWAALRTGGDTKRALDAFAQATRIAPSAPEPTKAYGYAYWLAGRDDEAHDKWESLLTGLLRDHKDDPDAQALKGWCLARLGRPQEAITEYLRAFPTVDRPTIEFDLALCQVQAGRPVDAQYTLKQAWHHLNAEPELRRRGILDAALQDINAVVAHDPGLRENKRLRKTQNRMTEHLAALPKIGGTAKGAVPKADRTASDQGLRPAQRHAWRVVRNQWFSR